MRHLALLLLVSLINVIAAPFLPSRSAAAPLPDGPTDFIRRIDLPTNDLVYSSTTGKLYASLPSFAGSNGNSIAAIDPRPDQSPALPSSVVNQTSSHFQTTVTASTFISRAPQQFAVSMLSPTRPVCSSQPVKTSLLVVILSMTSLLLQQTPAQSL